jgi:hypothetical protein
MTKNDPHPWRRGPGRAGADPRCGWCSLRQSDPIHVEAVASPAETPEDLGPFLRVADVRARYFPTITEKQLREWLSSGRLGVRPKKVGGILLIDEAALRAALAKDGAA